MLGAVGNDMASSAQSKCGGGGKTARLRLSWVGLGCTGGDGGVDSERGVSTGLDGVVGDMAGVWEVVSDETARFWVFWDEHSEWDRTWGCSEGSGRVCRRFGVVESGPGWGIAGDWAVVDSDVADCVDAWGIVVGSWRITGARGGMLEGAGGLLVRRWRRWGWQSCSVECTTRSDERVRTTSCNGVSWVVHRRCGLSGA
jgi:hypothetical protein